MQSQHTHSLHPVAKGLPSPVAPQLAQDRGYADLHPSLFCPGKLRLPQEMSRSSSPEGEAHLGLIPGTFSALEAPALPLKESLSTLLPLRDGAESEMV